MMMPPGIFAVPSNPTEGTSFYRAMGPLLDLQRTHGYRVTIASDVSWPHLAPHDIVFMNRAYKEVHLTCAKLARAIGKPLWVDLDDDLFALPEDNPAHDLYNDEVTQRRVTEILAMADVVTVSTEALARKLSKLNKDVRVIPNAWHERLLGPLVSQPATNGAFLWRGSHTHVHDIAANADQMAKGLSALPLWSMVFAGYRPWALRGKVDRYDERCIYTPPIDPMDYFHMVREVSPQFAIVPLVNNPFNRAKSNIAWLEATAIGAIALANRELPEWRIPGCMTYDESMPLGRLMTIAAGMDQESRHKTWMRSREYVQKNLMLEHVNKQRSDVVVDLMRLANDNEWRRYAIQRRGVAQEDTRNESTENQGAEA